MWKTATIGDVLSVIQNGINCTQDKSGKGLKITRIETIADANINFNKTGFSNLDDNQKQKAALNKGDILFSHINSPIHVGKTAIYDGSEPLYHGINLLRLRTIEDVDSKYFNFFLQSLFWSGYWRKTAKQSVNQASVNQTDIKKIPFAYPPLAEQERIVAKLDAAFAEIDEVIKIAKDSYAESSQIYQNELSEIFKNIEDYEPRRTLKDVSIQFGRGKSKHRPRNDERLYGDKMPFIQTGNISNTKMYINSHDKSYSEFGISQSKIWNKGTVCITIAANIAELAILDMDACFPDSVIGVYPDKEITSSEYIFYLLSFFQAYIKSKSKGSAQLNINLGTFESEKFPFPKNLIQQNLIVDKLNKLQIELGLYKSLQSKKIREMHCLKSLILKQELQSSEAA